MPPRRSCFLPETRKQTVHTNNFNATTAFLLRRRGRISLFG